MKLAGLKKILIIRLSSLGDVLLTTPVIRSIKKTYTEMAIDFVVRKDYSDVLKNNPHLNKLFNYSELHDSNENLKNTLVEQGYDLVIDLQNNFRSKELIRHLRCPKVKYRKSNFNKFLLVNFKINRLKNFLPVPERYSATIEDLHLDDDGLEFYSENKPNKVFGTEKNFIGICPGAKHFTKRWPKENYLELAKILEQKGFTVVFFGGKDDVPLCSELSVQLNPSFNLSNDNNLMQTAADMKMCKLIYCNDSGLMHLAAALKVPVIAFFGSTVREFGFYPYKAQNKVLEIESLRCRPCTHIGRNACPEKHFKCMIEISPQTAFDNLKNFIQTS